MRNHLILLFLIIILATILRLSYITYNPPSLNWDEVSHGYNAYSILRTGKDEWGKLLPLANFRAYGDYPLPLNLYLTIPFVAIFGVSELAIRLPHAMLGIITVVAVYFLGLGITKNKSVGLLAALLVAVDPWTLFTSRFVLQSNLSIFFLTAGAAAFVNREKHKFLLPLSFFFLGLTLFSYHSTRIFTPLFLTAVMIIYRNELLEKIKKEKLLAIISAAVIIIFFLPLPFILANPEARARSNVVFLLDQGAVNRIIEERQTSKLPESMARLIYNRPAYFARAFLGNYIEYFFPDFLFLKGGTQYQFSVPGYGLLLLLNLPLFYLGILIAGKEASQGRKEYQLAIAWLILSPIPAAITNEQFAVLRATTMLPLPEIFSAVGGLALWRLLEKKIPRFRGLALPLYLVLVAAFLENYLLTYFTGYRTNYSWAWQYGYKEVVAYAKEHYSEYDKIIVTKKYGEPHEYFLFFWPWEPAKYQNDPEAIRFNQSNWYWVDRFDKFYFVNDWQIPKSGKDFVLESKGEVSCSKAKCLLVTGPGNYPAGWAKLKTIDFLDGKPAFEIYEN